jgi:hypothetical protein
MILHWLKGILHSCVNLYVPPTGFPVRSGAVSASMRGACSPDGIRQLLATVRPRIASQARLCTTTWEYFCGYSIHG